MLLSFAVKRRRVFPSLETIARMVTISKQTVLNAIAWLALYGFLDRLRRIARIAGLLGPRVRQTSNASGSEALARKALASAQSSSPAFCRRVWKALSL